MRVPGAAGSAWLLMGLGLNGGWLFTSVRGLPRVSSRSVCSGERALMAAAAIAAALGSASVGGASSVSDPPPCDARRLLLTAVAQAGSLSSMVWTDGDRSSMDGPAGGALPHSSSSSTPRIVAVDGRTNDRSVDRSVGRFVVVVVAVGIL
eukprot:4274903-Pyramimonas_sp.AAC.1